ncbi:hypothetical protein GIB67_034649 [Kingdonia uniflora]|uniref:Uncharacterized protein n=1 Tax=Kingdonia uniflora TaxID=39325 RepID=A0A7J7P035_9MAGN|nr:hypothetical protein GIB67_034649 [Kingdonia uniflora]
MNNDDLPPPSLQIYRLVELILRITREIEYLEFKSSEVAAAVSISVIRETNLDKYEPCFIKNVQKERVFKCLELIHELQRSAAVQSVPQNPIGVLDVLCLSNKSDELPTVSSVNSSQEDSNFKREYQKIAMDMVLSIMKNNSKKQKLSTKDHVSHEDENKTSKDSVESNENDVQVLVGCFINDQH